MNEFIERYLNNINNIIANPGNDQVLKFAQDLYNSVSDLLQEKITAEQFDTIAAITDNDNDSQSVTMNKRALNHIKNRIADYAFGRDNPNKYAILNEVNMNREELVKLYGANKKFYAYNGIMERADIEKVVNIQFGLQYYQGITIIAVDTTITADNFIELV